MQCAAKTAAFLLCSGLLFGCANSETTPVSSDRGSLVQISQADLPRITARPFEGQFRALDPASQSVRHQNVVTLEFAKDGKSGKFFSDPYSWETTVSVRHGALHLLFGFANHPFTVHRIESGKLQLRTRYNGTSPQGYPIIGEVVITQH